MDDEDEVADLNLSSRPLREERQRLRERLRLERGMARSHQLAEASDVASPSSPRPSAARSSHGSGGNGAWLQLQGGSESGGGEEGANGAGHRSEDSPRLALPSAEGWLIESSRKGSLKAIIERVGAELITVQLQLSVQRSWHY